MKPCPICGSTAMTARARLGGYELAACTRCGLRFAPEAFGVPVDYGAVYTSKEYTQDQVAAVSAMRDPASFARIDTYRVFFENVPPRPGSTLLDVGRGVGRFCHAAHWSGWKVTGIDVSPKAIEIGQQHAKFPLQHRSAEELLAEKQRFDAVTAFEVLEHLPAPKSFLAGLKALAAPGGTVFCTVPNWDCPAVQQATRPDWIPPIHLCFFTLGALRQLGLEAGFRRVTVGYVRTDRLPLRPVALAKWVARRVRGDRPPGLWLVGQV